MNERWPYFFAKHFPILKNYLSEKELNEILDEIFERFIKKDKVWQHPSFEKIPKEIWAERWMRYLTKNIKKFPRHDRYIRGVLTEEQYNYLRKLFLERHESNKTFFF